MAETVEGSFTFTVLDADNNLYVVRGDNPFAIGICHGFALNRTLFSAVPMTAAARSKLQ